MPATRFPTLSPSPLPSAQDYGLLPKAFDLPSERPALARHDSASVSFRPPQTGAHGRVIDSFADFRADPLFARSQQEIMARMDELSSTAQGWNTRHGDATVERLQGFKTKLVRGADPLLGPALDVIHGAGKRGLDEFCALMREPTIDEHARRCALVDFAADLTSCGPRIGSAMASAPHTLLLAQGGLHAELYRRNRDLINQSLKQAYREQFITPEEQRRHEGMESHAVLQLRRELGLPGSELEDLFASQCLVTHGMIARARALVDDRIGPAALAGQMAADVLQELHSRLRAEHGEDLSLINPMDGHADAVRRIMDDLNLRYGGIRFDSVVVPRDEDGTRGAIATDPSLVALDLMGQMARSGLAPEPTAYPIATWPHAEGQTSLSHVGSRIFFLEHQSPLRPEVERAPVTLGSLAEVPVPGASLPMAVLRDPRRPIGPWREHLAATLIQALPSAELVDFPRDWLADDALATALLTRMTPAQYGAWCAKGPVPEAVSAVALRLDRQAELERQIHTFRRAQQMLGTSDPVLLREALRQCHRHPDMLARLLRTPAEGIPPPLRQAMIAGDPACADLLFLAVQRLAAEQYLTPEQERRLLIGAMDDAALRHPDHVDVWLRSVDAAVKSGRMTAKQALKVITRRGPHSMDALQWVCGGSKAGALRGWVGLVARARRLGLIERDIGLQILRAPGGDTSFLNSSQFRENRVGMRELLEGYVDAARQGDLDGAELRDLLREVSTAIPSLWQRARSHADAHEHLASFMDAALAATIRKTLGPDDYLTLIAPRGSAVPLLSSLCEPLRQEGLKVYLKKLVIASAGGVLPVESLRALLLARSDGGRADIAGVSATAKQRLLETVDHLLDCQLIDASEAARLSQEIAEAVRGNARGTSRKGAGTVVG